MTQALGPFRQVCVVQSKSAVVFDDAQTLGQAILIRVDDPQGLESVERIKWHGSCTVHVATSLAYKLTVTSGDAWASQLSQNRREGVAQ